METSEIAEFFKGQSVFLTGATGFVGKGIVEKILRSCSQVSKIYILMRPNRHGDIQTRLETLLQTQFFDRIRNMEPSLFSKAIPICGDISLPDLGMSPEDWKTVSENVSVILHSAATVKFNLPLKESVKINVGGTHQVLRLAKSSRNLKSFVHISTAYSNSEKDYIEERLYPVNLDPENVIHCFESMSAETATALQESLLGEKPNTYTYTKHLAEALVGNSWREIPCCIVRPAIVGAAVEEPIPGWVDNVNACSGIFAAWGKGVLRALPISTNEDLRLDVVPLDYVVNITLAAAWRTAAVSHNNENELQVYNFSLSPTNPLTHARIVELGSQVIEEMPFNNVFWFPRLHINHSPKIYSLMDTAFHKVPAYVSDSVSALFDRKPTMMKVYQRIKDNVDAVNFFVNKQFDFQLENRVRLASEMCPKDQETFPFDMATLNWPIYFQRYFYGLRKYTLKEEDSDVPKAIKHMRKMKTIHNSIVAFIFVGLCLLLAILLPRVVSVLQ